MPNAPRSAASNPAPNRETRDVSNLILNQHLIRNADEMIVERAQLHAQQVDRQYRSFRRAYRGVCRNGGFLTYRAILPKNVLIGSSQPKI